MTELPEDNRYGIIMTCIDHFGKIVVLVTLQESNTQTAASHFLVEVVNHHGLLATFIINKEPKF